MWKQEGGVIGHDAIMWWVPDNDRGALARYDISLDPGEKRQESGHNSHQSRLQRPRQREPHL